MKKIPSVFVRDWEGTLGPPGDFITRTVDPRCQWVADGEGVARQKYDGTAMMIRDGKAWKRLKVLPGRPAPSEFEPTGDPDPRTGKQFGWIPVTQADRWHHEALESGPYEDGTYELIGPKVASNPERSTRHVLVAHACAPIFDVPDRSYDGIQEILRNLDVEGFVFYGSDGRMAKIKKKDFGMKR